MRSLIHYVEQQINQLEHAELKQWLLHHFNKSASHLSEIFTQQHPTDNSSPVNLSIDREQHLLFNIIYAYGPQALIPELQKHAASFASLNVAAHNHAFLQYSTGRLNALRDAWTLIGQIMQQPQELIAHLRQAGRVALEAFKQLDENWSLLVKPFLAKDSREISDEERKNLINYLRGPHWQRQLGFFKKEVNALLSLHWLVQSSMGMGDELERLQQAQWLCNEYPFTFDKSMATALVRRNCAALTNKDALAVNKEFIVFLDLLLARMDEVQQFVFIQSIRIFYRLDLIEHCLKFQPMLDAGYAEAYQRVVLLLCSHPASLQKDRDLIRFQLIKSEHVFPIQLSIKGLNNPAEVFSALEHVLRAESFIATATPDAIKSLSLRYRCLALTYKHDELMTFIKFAALEISPYYYQLMEQLYVIEQQLAAEPEQPALLDKKKRLITWFMERMLHGAIDTLITEYMNNPAKHQHALARFFAYYHSLGDSLRSDLLFHAVNFSYFLDDKASRQSRVVNLEQWRRTFDGRWEDCFKSFSPYLYSANGACIALVDELNRVWNLTADEPLVMGRGKTEHDYFNQHMRYVGNLTDSGHFRPSGMGQQLSMHILGGVPIAELEKSTQGLAWLMRHFLLERSMPLLYQYKGFGAGSPKWIWLQEQCNNTLATITYPLAASAAEALVSHIYGEQLFLLAPISACPANSLLLFHSFVANAEFTASWLCGHHTPEFRRFLEPLGALPLVDYLLHYHCEPWFADGLALFAAYPLAQALAILSEQAAQQQLPETIWRAILWNLSKSEKVVRVLLACFGQDNAQQPVQDVDNPELDNILHYFGRSHLMALIRRLISMPTWSQCQQYRFALLLLQAQHDELFQADARRALTWRTKEISNFALFINRHLEEKHPWDRNCSLGFKLLGAITFQHAEQGQNTLFWRGPQKINRVAALLVSPAMLEHLVDKFILPRLPAQENGVLGERDSARERREYREQLLLQWPNNTVLRDWHNLIGTPDNKQQIPLLGLYLLHYSGVPQTARQLAEQYFLSVKPGMQSSFIHPLSTWLVHFPNRDISALLFDSIQRVLIRKPALLDATILGHCAQFWAAKKGMPTQTLFGAELQLINQWGKAKQYELVALAAQLLLNECQDTPLQQKLAKAQVEAQVEAKILQLLKDYPNFAASVKWLKRVWNYGFNWRGTRSDLVELADTELGSESRLATFSPKRVGTGVVMQAAPAVHIENDFINLLAEVVRSSFHSSVELLARARTTLFAHPERLAPPLRLVEDDASKQSMANV